MCFWMVIAGEDYHPAALGTSRTACDAVDKFASLTTDPGINALNIATSFSGPSGTMSSLSLKISSLIPFSATA